MGLLSEVTELRTNGYGAIPRSRDIDTRDLVEEYSDFSEQSSDQSKTISKVGRQHLAAILGALSALVTGTIQGWTAPALPYLLHENLPKLDNENITTISQTPGITIQQASIIGAIAALGGLVGALPAGPLADTLGRKKLLLLLTFPFFVGWIIIPAAPESVPWIYTSRFISGVAMGAVTVVVPLYSEEIAEDRVRGALGVYLDLMVTVGILVSYVLGSLVSYRDLALAGSLLPLVFAATFLWMPESPLYLVTTGKVDQAEKALRWLRGAETLQDAAVKSEMVRIQRTLEEGRLRTSYFKGRSTLTAIKGSFRNLLMDSPTGRAVFIVFGLMIFQQLSGINAIVFYTVDIFIGFGGSSLSPQLSTIVVGVVQLVATFVSFFLVDRIGRRILLIVSELLMALSLGILALDVSSLGQREVSLGWVPLTCLVVYLMAYSLGLGPIPWLIMAEIAPTQYKGLISSLAVFLNWCLVFAVTYFFNSVMIAVGRATTYGVLCGICILGAGFVFLVVPETKGKSRDEIQTYLRNKTHRPL